MQHAHRPGPATRPGPAPQSARQAALVNAQNASLRREVAQTIADCKRAIADSDRQQVRRAQSLPFAQIDFDRRTDGEELADDHGNALGLRRYRVGSLWVIATSLRNGWGDHQYFIFNPQTGAILHFIPEASRVGSAYQSRQASIQNTAAATGVVGGWLEKGFFYVGAGFMTGGMALELGGAAVVTEQALPAAQRTVAVAWQLVRPGLQAMGKRMVEGMGARVGTDLGVQVVSGAVNSHGSLLDRGKQIASGINGSSLVVAAVINSDGLKLGRAAKWLLAAGSAAAGNLVTVSIDNYAKYGNAVHGVDFTDFNQTDGFIFNVIAGAILDRSKEKLAEAATGKVLKKVAEGSGRVLQAAGRHLDVKRVALGSTFGIGSLLDSGKKWGETRWGAYNDTIKAQEARKMPAPTPRLPHPKLP